MASDVTEQHSPQAQHPGDGFMAMNSRGAAVAEVPFRCAEAMKSSMPLISLTRSGGGAGVSMYGG